MSIYGQECTHGNYGTCQDCITEDQKERDSLRAQLAEAQGESRKLRVEARRAWNESPAFDTFVYLKYAKPNILQLLQDGAISRGKAAEALAELAHGKKFEEIRLPVEDESPVFADDEEPREVVNGLRERIATLEAALEKIADDGVERSRDPRTLIAREALAAVKGERG